MHMNAEEKNVKGLHVELPAGEYDRLQKEANAAHRSLKGEVRRLIRQAYGMESDQAPAVNARECVPA